MDVLPEDELEPAGRVLAELSALAKAPMGSEPVTARETKAIKDGGRDFERGRIVTADEFRARLGL